MVVVAAALTMPSLAKADGDGFLAGPGITSQSTNWTGFYVGANAGWAGTNYDNKYVAVTSSSSALMTLRRAAMRWTVQPSDRRR